LLPFPHPNPLHTLPPAPFPYPPSCVILVLSGGFWGWFGLFDSLFIRVFFRTFFFFFTLILTHSPLVIRWSFLTRLPLDPILMLTLLVGFSLRAYIDYFVPSPDSFFALGSLPPLRFFPPRHKPFNQFLTTQRLLASCSTWLDHVIYLVFSFSPGLTLQGCPPCHFLPLT